MYNHVCTAFAFTLTLYLLGNVSAGSNGDAPQEGQDWIVTQDTHVWDAEINVKDIVLTFGKTLKLENVTLTSEGYIDIHGDAKWINSTIYHKQSMPGDNISLYGKLEIINSDLTLNSLQKNSEITANCLDLNQNSILIVTDFDLNPETTNDRSMIKSEITGKGNYTERLNYTVQVGRLVNNQPGSGIPNTKVIIENSDFEYIKAIRFTGEGSYVRNSTFDMIGIISYFNDNFTFTNNTINSSYIFYDLFISGNNALVRDNVFKNGTDGVTISNGHNNLITNNTFRNYIYKDASQHNRGAATITHGSNNTVINNLFENNEIHDLALGSTDDNIISNNNFNTSGLYWHNVVDRAGNRNNYNNNTFTDCGSLQPFWLHTCIVFWLWDGSSYNDSDYYSSDHLIENNVFDGYQIAIRFASFQNNATIRNNHFDNGWNGVGLWGWPEGGIAPSGHNIINNTINNTEYAIALDWQDYQQTGKDIRIAFNHITNASGKGISVWSYYKNFTIENNYIENSSQGIWVYDSNFGEISNGIIANNTLVNISYNGIHAFTSFSGNVIENLHVTNNFVHSFQGAGIVFNDVHEGFIANNTIRTNISHESQLSGIFAYYIPETVIQNNTVTSAVGIEVGGGIDSPTPIKIMENTLMVNDYGIISNRTYSEINDNNVTGFCYHDKCNILYLQKVAAVGIFSQEGEVQISNNNLLNFKEAITIVLAEFDLDENIIDFSEMAITANNSEGSISDNSITNNTRTLSVYKSIINIKDNSFTDFEKGIYAVNSSLRIEDNFFTDGDFCIDLIDSDYQLITNDFDCRDMDYQVRYNIRINIADEFGTGSEEHLFDIFNSEGTQIVDSLTGDEGFSNYFQIDIEMKEAGEGVVNFNPIKIVYDNNEVPVILYRNISFNHTIVALLDTSSPTSILSPGLSLINQDEITLEIILLEDNDDLKNYVIEYLVNEEFAEWEIYGTYTSTTVNFEGNDGNEYRFRVLARDIYGNIEVKDTFEYQVKVDISTPYTHFNNFDEDYYFTGSENLELYWTSEDLDISRQILEIYYTNFSDPYLNPNSVTWFLIDSFNFEEENGYEYEFKDVGHYAFKILSEDFAGNLEIKNKFDVIFNYDSDSDTLTFGDIPARWGEDSLTIDYTTSSFNLDFDLFISLESLSEEVDYLTWYKYEYEIASNSIILKGLLDDTRYYVYAVSRDLAGNIENPLNTTEFYSSNGLYDQVFDLKYIPLLEWNYDIVIEIDNDLDGTYETALQRGIDRSRLKSNEYFFDTDNNRIVFGGLSNGGFVPNEDLSSSNNVKISYSGVQGIFEVFTGEPETASALNIVPSNTTELVVSFVVPNDSQVCKVQRTTNISKGFFNEMIIEPCGEGQIEYVHKNPDLNEIYYYRILIEDEFGHESISENRSIDMKDVVKLYSTSDDSNTGLLGMDSIIPITALVGIIMLGFGGVLLYRSRNNEILDENVSVIESKPVAKYKVEELYLIYKDGRLVKNLSDVEVKTDSDIMSGMLTAINDFVQDSFNTEGDLGSIDYGNNKIILQRGQNSYLAAVVYGEVDKFFKGKMINAVRNIENVNPTMSAWNGDSETILHTEHYLQPIIDETKQSTKEMVDNYFSEKEIVLTTSYEKIDDSVELQVNMSNYSSGIIKNCSLTPEFNSLNLSIVGIEPDVFYSFSDNSFIVGEIESYNEVSFKLKFKLKVAGSSPIEVKMNYEQKGRKGVSNSLVEIV